jgi:hypothetical protein
MDPTRYERCKTVDRALGLLGQEWSAALMSLQARFDCGVLAGTPVERLAEALDVEVVVVEPTLETRADAVAPDWRPRFRFGEGEFRRRLYIPSDRLVAHRDVMLASYILRATADAALKWALPDAHKRNPVLRNEVDRLMFGDFPQFRSRLADFGSIEAVQAADIPLHLVGGYLTKHIPSASLESFFCLTPYYGNRFGDVNSYMIPIARRLGNGPVLFDRLKSWRVKGDFTFHHPRVQHAIRQAKYDVERLVVAVSRPLSDIVQPDSGDALVAVTKAVAWSCGLRDVREVFSRPKVALLH